MDKQKLLEYAQYGCAQKMNDYRILAEKAGSAIKADTAYTLYQQAQEDCQEINRMIAEKQRERYALPIYSYVLYSFPSTIITFILSHNLLISFVSISMCLQSKQKPALPILSFAYFLSRTLFAHSVL